MKFRQRDGRLSSERCRRRSNAAETTRRFLPNGQLRVSSGPLPKQPFPNNIIPTSALDAAGVKLANAPGPAPNGRAGLLRGWTPSPPRPCRLQRGPGSRTPSTTLIQGVEVLRFLGHQFLDLGGWDPFGNRTHPIDPGRAEKDHFQNVVASLTAVFSPRLLGVPVKLQPHRGEPH
jgi:hypothetical protein